MSKLNLTLIGLLFVSISLNIHFHTLSERKCPEYKINRVDDEVKLLIEK